jgi:hypothetical protein
MTFGVKLMLGAILAAFVAFHAATLYQVAPLLQGHQSAPAAMLGRD